MDYRKYKMTIKERVKYSVLYAGVFLLLAYLFFDSFYAALFGIPLLPFLLKRQSKKLAGKRQEQLSSEFKDFILSFSASLKTGCSVENAFAQAYRDLLFLYGETGDMVIECRRMVKQLQNNKVLEDLLTDFGLRSGQNEIWDFASIFAIAKRSGGNMNAIIRNTADIISEKIEVKREIRLMFAAKRIEQNIMNFVPMAIIGYVRLTTPDYFDSIYHNPFGIAVMSVCLIVYMFSYFLSQKIMNIEV